MTQYARPISDIENPGGWATTPLWEKLDEEPFDDGDFIESPKSAAGASFTIGLSAVPDPGIHTDHIVRIRAKTGVSGTFKYELLQGAIVIKDSGNVVLGTSEAEYNMVLTEEEAGNISDYGAFRLRVTAITTQKNQRQNVSWIRVDIPDATGEEHSGSGSISGNGSVAGSIKKGGKGSALASATGTMVALGIVGMLGIVGISGGGSQIVVGKKTAVANAFISGGGSITAIGEKEGVEEPSGIAIISGGGSLVSEGRRGAASSVTISANGNFSTSGKKAGLSFISISARGLISAKGEKDWDGDSLCRGSGLGLFMKMGMN